MPKKIFISYRRDDSRYQARMIHTAFRDVLPDENVFMDVDSIPLGANFRKILKGWVDECEILLALIGPGWIGAVDQATGLRRLDNPSDFVRIEISEALARDIPVVPVLIDRAPMPQSAHLPDDLKELADRQAEFLEYRTFDNDVERLIAKLGLRGSAPQTVSQKTPSAKTPPQPSNIIIPEMVGIPAGTFMMGEGSDAHKVTISKSFAMGKYAVTFDEWDAYCDAKKLEKPSDHGWGRGRRPVINVSWEDAQAYIKWLNDKTGQTYRLPTEAEWEYACRAGTTTEYSFGDSITKQHAQFSEGTWGSAKHTVEVGSFPSNQFGLYDMHGNVWEWCSDWDGNYKKGHKTDPQGPNSGSYRVYRGGSWFSVAGFLRSADRYHYSPGNRDVSLGFRLLRQSS